MESDARFGPQTFLAFSAFTNLFALKLETRLYYLSITITTDPSPAQMAFKFDNSSNFQNLITNNPLPCARKSICDLCLRLKTIIDVSSLAQFFFPWENNPMSFNPISKVWKFNWGN